MPTIEYLRLQADALESQGDKLFDKNQTERAKQYYAKANSIRAEIKQIEAQTKILESYEQLDDADTFSDDADTFSDIVPEDVRELLSFLTDNNYKPVLTNNGWRLFIRGQDRTRDIAGREWFIGFADDHDNCEIITNWTSLYGNHWCLSYVEGDWAAHQ